MTITSLRAWRNHPTIVSVDERGGRGRKEKRRGNATSISTKMKRKRLWLLSRRNILWSDEAREKSVVSVWHNAARFFV